MSRELFNINDGRSLPWTLASIDFNSIDTDSARKREDVFVLVCSSSFIESGSDLYTQNLVRHFPDDIALQTWLSQHWEQEELQHGRALSAYIQHVWPEFDWHAAYQCFWNEYSKQCLTEYLEQSRGLELVARCVVETGTASLYRALSTMRVEPVLTRLAANIMSDEIRHYKNFYHHFKRYRENEQLSRLQILAAILRRVGAIRNEDSDIALRHVFNERYPLLHGNHREYRRVASATAALLRNHGSTGMAVKMLLKPLGLSSQLEDVFEKPLALISRKLFLH
ncbi:MAG: ferritin-like domain-containing protein [Steroidobacter sp.]